MNDSPAGDKSVEIGGLVPRFARQGYDPADVKRRRTWVEAATGEQLPHIGACSVDTQQFRGNIENPIGAVQTPVGVAGPLLVHGEHASGVFYVPLATTEGALVRSYERGMVALTRADGVIARVHDSRNRVSPMFHFDDVAAARDFVIQLPTRFEALRERAQSTTSHGRLLSVDPVQVGRSVVVEFHYDTRDAHGMNMIVKATQVACDLLIEECQVSRFTLFSGASSEKRAAGNLFKGGKGRHVSAGARLTDAVVKRYLNLSARELYQVWHDTVIGHLVAGASGYNAHYANGLTALFIATGQDVANVTNSAVGVSNFELEPDGSLFVSVTLPALSVATVGGGTGLGTSRECLGMIGCSGAGKALKLAEITAATLLAGEISMGGAIGSGDFVGAHEAYGRNRPEAEE